VNTGESIHLLIVEESSSDANALANELKQSGHSFQFSHAESAETLEKTLDKQLPDIVICAVCEGLPSPEAIKTELEQRNATTAIIAIADAAPEAEVLRMEKSGIAALVSYEYPDHLHVAFARQAEAIGKLASVRQLEAKLRDSEARCHELIEKSSDAVAYIHEGMHVYANRPYMELFDIGNAEDIEGTPMLDMISPDGRSTFKNFLKNYEDSNDGDNTLAIDCISPQNGEFNCTMECAPASMDGESCTQIIIRVSSDNAELEARIRTLSQKDMLTGLWNRQHFMQELEHLDDQGPGQECALAYLALDNFKSVREEAGVASSDLVLCDIANLLQQHISQDDCLARFGDFVFTIIKSGADQDAIRADCEELLKKISGHLSHVEGKAFSMTASLGLCAITEHRKDPQKLVSYADMACEVARTSGGNQLHTHSTVVDEDSGQEQEWDQVIRDTIDQERFYLVYQPIVSLKGDTTQRYEVLLRIIDEQGHVILPGQFLSIAEKTGMSREIDRWVINKAFEVLAEARTSNPVSFFIKLSGASIADPELPEWISGKLREHRLVSDGVVFEVPERIAISDLASAMNFVQAMQSLHCKVALEHFGVDDQPQLLNHVPADILKIDGSLISSMGEDGNAQARVRSIAEFARENNKICFAEFVADAGCLAMLWQIGVDGIQGNFIQEPAKTLDYIFENEIA
jgi:diguanylate cyclase (GGDEF)-like protein